MALQFNYFSISLVFSMILSSLLAFEAMKPKYAARAKFFALLMFFVAAWSATYALELASTDFSSMVFWSKAEYLFIPFVPVFLYLVVRQYAGLKYDFKRRYLFYLLPIPILTLLLNLTNESNNLFYTHLSLDNSGNIPLLKLEIGPWYVVHQLYSFSLIIAAVIILIRKLFFERSLFRNQLIYMLIAVLIPAVSLLMYLTGFFPFKNIDPTPFALTFSGLAMSISILRYRMLDLMPIAREHVFTSTPDGLVVLDNKMRIVDANPGSMKIFGWNKIPLGHSAQEVWQKYPLLVKMSQATDIVSYELEILQENKRFYYQISSSEILNYKKVKVGCLLIIHDITMRQAMQEAIRQSEEKLKKLNAEKDKLFSVIAHDLRGPLGAFAGLTEMVMQQTDDMQPEEMRQLAADMHKSALALQNLLENLLFWSRMQREDVKINIEKLDVKALLEEILNLFQTTIKTKELEVRTSFGEDAKVLADRQMLMTILRNLLSNALKFTQRKGTINLVIQLTRPGIVQIQVADSGIGMDEAMLQKLFNIEGKTGRPGTEGEASSGLGLILSHEFVEKMGGNIQVKSSMGVGSTFIIELPLA
ncbi:MAG: histidine kinase N-terminal 7TM domain-containing protein [Bacteroidales bacterium]|jgi:PAS domain S-box-containing protein|nr:histidine kinase N-terminal 7TM domain-containing protein [Bacteroidales bacterium]